EDGIRDPLVTGVQTCALPICRRSPARHHPRAPPGRGRSPRRRDERGGSEGFHGDRCRMSLLSVHELTAFYGDFQALFGVTLEVEIGRASCRERVENVGVAVAW